MNDMKRSGRTSMGKAAMSDETDESRRGFALALLGAIGGANLLASCANGERGEAVPEAFESLAEALSGGATLKYADSVTELRALAGGATIVAVLKGFATIGDGGGGVFYWGAAAPDNGGTILNAGPGNVAGWRRVYSGPINVRWFGAVGDGTAPDDAAIQKAIDEVVRRGKAINLLNAPFNVSNSAATYPQLFFPSGLYKIASELVFPGLMVAIESDSKAVIQQTSASAIFRITQAERSTIRGLTFVGGTIQVWYDLANNTPNVQLQIDDCDFNSPSTVAIKARQVAPSDGALSTELTVRNCRFLLNASAIETWADWTSLRDCWINVYSLPQDTAVFKNMRNTLTFDTVLMWNPSTQNLLPRNRWIDNYGSFKADGCYFGGESGGGMHILFNYAELPVGAQEHGSIVSIKNCGVNTPGGTGSPPESSVVNIVNGCFTQFEYVGNSGPPQAPPLVRAESDTALANHIAAHPNAQYIMRLKVESERAGYAYAVPPALMPFVEGSPWPTHAITGNVLQSPPNPYLAYYSFSIPNAAGFVAEITVSLNPAITGSGAYRAVGIYYVSMMPCYDGANVSQYLSATKAFEGPYHPASEGWASYKTAIDNVCFGTSLGGSNTRVFSQQGGTFTIFWRAAGPIVSPTTPQIKIRLIHVLS